jgi:hypothetical protein
MNQNNSKQNKNYKKQPEPTSQAHLTFRFFHLPSSLLFLRRSVLARVHYITNLALLRLALLVVLWLLLCFLCFFPFFAAELSSI